MPNNARLVSADHGLHSAESSARSARLNYFRGRFQPAGLNAKRPGWLVYTALPMVLFWRQALQPLLWLD